MAWCVGGVDANLLAGLGPSRRVIRLGPSLPHQEVVKGFADREGVALVATDNFDAAGDAEDPVLRALEELVPSWRRAGPYSQGAGDLRLAYARFGLGGARAGAEVVPAPAATS